MLASTEDQDLSLQKTALERDGCHIIFEEKVSGTKWDGGEKLDLALKVLAKGDSLVVTRLDRLGDRRLGVRRIGGAGSAITVTRWP